MKNIFLLLTVIVLLSSCTQKQFAFRKKIAVNHTDKVTVKTQPHNTNDNSIDHTSNVEANEQITYNEPHSFIAQQEELAPTNVSVIPDDTIRKKYKFDEEKKPNNSTSPNNDYEPDSKADNDALIGFILGLAGIFLIQLAAIPGLIYSIRGLKSYKRKGLATAGVIINAVVILLLILLFVFLFVLIASL
jgi:hypothetical protein